MCNRLQSESVPEGPPATVQAQKQPDQQKQQRRHRHSSMKQPYRGLNKRRLNGASTSTDATKSSASASASDVDADVDSWRHKLEYLMYMIVGVDLLIVIALASIMTFGVSRLGRESEWLSFITASQPAVGILGAFYSFALVFRTNICYSRWWEGRELWGSMIVCSIRIAQQAHLWVKEPALVHRVSCLAIIFAYCCKAQLNGAGVDDTEDGANLLQKGVISQEELDLISGQSGWQSFYCIDAMRAVISSGLEADSIQDQWKNNAAQTAMEETICKLADGIGGCIRVKSTGLPVAYDVILNMTGFIFFAAGCLAWAPGAGFYNPILVLIVYIIVKMITGVGSLMEDPFGDDESDLPLGKYCEEIDKQITAIDERAKLTTYLCV